MATIEIPAEYVGPLKSAAIYTLAEEARRVRDHEREVWEAERSGRGGTVELAERGLADVRPFLERSILLNSQIQALPDGRSVSLEEEPELAYYLLHNMASKILGPQVAALLDYLPMPEELPSLATALAWASVESIRLEMASVDAVRAKREATGEDGEAVA